MIPNRTQDVQVTNNIASESTGQFTVDENSLGKIMSVLTNLYTDPEMAVVREYLTNALDAQIEAQLKDPNYVWRPIEVTTPSHFSKEYKVRDFGIGMSVDDIKEIYSKYGKSTKENSNDVTGMLGLGSKCALTYTGQFTITGYKNGVRTRAVVSKDDNDIPVFMIVDTRSTTEPNGVEISVPVRNSNSFESKALGLLRWWKDGQVLINGVEPEKHSYKEVKPGVFLIERDRNTYLYGTVNSYVIMGNVPYQVDPEYVDSSLRDAGLGFAAYVPMGTVDFPPSREHLFYNNRTKKAIKDISDGLYEAIIAERRRQITDASSHREAWVTRAALPAHFARHHSITGLTYKGDKFIDRLDHKHTVLDWDWQGHGQIANRGSVNLGNVMGGSLIVTGVKVEKPTPAFKKKVKHYISVNSIDASHALLVDEDIDNKWFDWIPRVSEEDIKAIKLPKDTAASTPRTEATYDYWTVDAGTIDYNSATTVPVAKGKKIAYISPSDIRETYRNAGTTEQSLARALGEDYVLVVLAKNRFEKFLRNHTAITVQQAIQERVTALANASSPMEQVVSDLSYSENQFMGKADGNAIDDPDIKALIVAVKGTGNSKPSYKQAMDLVAYARLARCSAVLPDMKKGINPVNRYPLIDAVGGRHISHLTAYINAVYAQTQKP